MEILAAESVAVPVGLALVAYLSRRLGVEGYGEFVLVVAVVTWIEWALAALFSRAAVQLVAEAGDWRAPAATLVWLHGIVGIAGGAALLAAAPWIASSLGAPAAVPGLRVLACDIPLFCLAQAHRQVAIGIGAYRVRAVAVAGRSFARLGLVIGLVQLGLSVPGALAAQVGASAVELLLCRRTVRPGWWRDHSFPAGKVLRFAGPLFAAAVAMRLYERLDLFMLQRMLSLPEQTALYGAAQQLAMLPLVVSAALVPVLSSTLVRLSRDGQIHEAGRQLWLSVRVVALMVPLVALPAGSGADIAQFVFGAPFVAAGGLLGPLLLTFVCYIGVYVATATFIAAGRARWFLALASSMLVIACLANVVVIPRFGSMGAARVSLGTGALGALAGLHVAARLFPFTPERRAIIAPLAIAVLGFVASAAVPSRGWQVIAEMIGLGVLTAAGLLVSGALTRRDTRLLWKAVSGNG